MDESAHLIAARAVYDHSADQYVDAVGTEIDDRFETPLDQALLDLFAASVEQAGSGIGPVLDAGCGPGRVAAYLARRGLAVRGVDLSRRMVEAARAAHPTISFDQAPLTTLGVADGSLAGAVYWYSIITTPPDELPAVWAELSRAAAPGAPVLVAFQAGAGEAVERPDAYGSTTTLTLHRHLPATVAASLRDAGFDLGAEITRQPERAHETTPQAFVTATWPGGR